MKCFHAKSEVFKMILGAVTLQLCGILIRSCVTSVNGTTSVLVGHPSNCNTTDITATHGENVTLMCSRNMAWKRWTSDMNELNRNSSHNIRIRIKDGYYNLIITSFQSLNTGMYTCGVTVRTNITSISNKLTADTASIVNYTVGISLYSREMSHTKLADTPFFSVCLKNSTLSPTSSDPLGDTVIIIIAVTIGTVLLCLIITILVCIIAAVSKRKRKRNKRRKTSSNSSCTPVVYAGQTNDDAYTTGMVLSNPPVSQEVDNVIFEEKEINYDFIKDIRNEPEGSHNTKENKAVQESHEGLYAKPNMETMQSGQISVIDENPEIFYAKPNKEKKSSQLPSVENIKSVQESPYSQINDLEVLYAKPNMEAMQSGQTSVILDNPEILYDTPTKVKNESSRQHIDTITTEKSELLYTQPNKVKKTSEQITSEMPTDEINYEPSTDEVSESEAPPEVPPQSADILYSAVY